MPISTCWPVNSTTPLVSSTNSGPYGAGVFCQIASTLCESVSLSTETPLVYGLKPRRPRSPWAR